MDTHHADHNSHHAKQKRRLRTRLFASAEGHILLTGLSLGLLYLVWLGVNFFWSPEKFHLFVGMTAAHLFFGRAAGMSFGYTVGLPNSVVILVNLAIETLILLLFYPLFVFSWRHLVEISVLKKLMARTHEAAEANRHLIRRYGIIGLFVFVWFPFWMTGSLVGCVIGFLIGFHPWLTVAIVFGGTNLAIISWAILLRELHARVEFYNPYAPVILLAIVISIAVGARIFQGWRRGENHSHNE